MKQIFTSFLLFIFSLFNSQDFIDFNTVVKDGSKFSYRSGNYLENIAIDSNENVFMCGVYEEKIGFNMFDDTNFHLVYPNKDFSKSSFLVKYDKNKQYQWYKTISFSEGERGGASMTSIAIDKNDNVFVTGIAYGYNIDLYSSDDSSKIYNQDKYIEGIFLLKFSKDGELLLEQFYENAVGIPQVALDSKNNIYLSGTTINYNGVKTDFNPNSDVYNSDAPDMSIFILKLDKDGEFKWVKYIDGHNGAQIGRFQFDSKDNLVFSGINEYYFDYNGEYRSTISVNLVDRGNYIGKIDPNGRLLWLQALRGASGTFVGSNTADFCIGCDDSIVVFTSKNKREVTFPNYTYYPNNTYGIVLFKLSADGEYIWHTYLDPIKNGQDILFGKSIFIDKDFTINF